MSVTFTLYNLRPDVEFQGYWWMAIPPSKMNTSSYEDLQAMLGGPISPSSDMSEEEHAKLFSLRKEWEGKMKSEAFSDGKTHELIDLDDKKRYFRKCRGGRRMIKRLNKIPSKCFNEGSYNFKYLICDVGIYRQGWFLSNRFFKKKFWTYYCTSKKELENFFKRYLNHKDPNGTEAMNAFMNAWEDGMLFECSW